MSKKMDQKDFDTVLNEVQEKEDEKRDYWDRLRIREEMMDEGVWDYVSHAVEEHRRLQVQREKRKKERILLDKCLQAVFDEMAAEGPWHDYDEFEAEAMLRLVLKTKQVAEEELKKD